MRRTIKSNEILNPERILSNLINDYVDGELDDKRFLLRASVVEIDTVGGQFEVNPPNPKNSIKARVISQNFNANTDYEDLPIFYPLFPYIVQPVKEKEHIYVIFEDDACQNGLWLTRIAEPLNVDNDNYVAGAAKYAAEPDNDISGVNVEQVVAGMALPPPNVEISPEFITEEVPSFSPRVGDLQVKGSNNTLIVLGRDRPTNKESGQSESAGTIDIVAGRQTLEDMDMVNDKARVYISSMTDADTNFDTGAIGSSAQPSATVALIADEIRIKARQGMKIVSTADAIIEGANILIGNNASQKAVLGDQLVQLLTELITQISAITVITAVGNSSPPVNAPAISALAARLNTILSQTVKVKS
jgi:hypothetical protein